ncbi:MAG TPA: hypothetical protein VIW69_00015 [Candidatus Elarobacter sp.]
MGETILLEAQPYRRVILHYHIMKNAGTTIESILAREFDDAFYSVHRRENEGTIDADAIADILAAKPSAVALTSHHFAFPRPEIPFTSIVDCCPIRHPLDRLESLHRYLSRIEPVDAVSALATNSEAPAFLRTLLERFPNYVQNVQTIAIANGTRFRSLSDRDFATADAVVQKSGLHVVVDRLDESLTVGEYFLRPVFAGLRLHYVSQNITQERGMTLGERQERLCARLDATLLQELRAANEFDMRLYETANRELDRRIRLVPSFEKRLANFRARCAAATPPVAALRAAGNF